MFVYPFSTQIHVSLGVGVRKIVENGALAMYAGLFKNKMEILNVPLDAITLVGKPSDNVFQPLKNFFGNDSGDTKIVNIARAFGVHYRIGDVFDVPDYNKHYANLLCIPILHSHECKSELQKHFCDKKLIPDNLSLLFHERAISYPISKDTLRYEYAAAIAKWNDLEKKFNVVTPYLTSYCKNDTADGAIIYSMFDNMLKAIEASVKSYTEISNLISIVPLNKINDYATAIKCFNQCNETVNLETTAMDDKIPWYEVDNQDVFSESSE